MKTIKVYRMARQFALATVSALVLTSWPPDIASAQEKQLALNGHRWEQPTVTYWISAAKDVAPEAAAEVQTALDDWRTALASVPGAPTLQWASSSRNADLILDLRAAETRRIRGGPATPLGGGMWFKTTGKPNSPSCSLASAGIELRGSRLVSPPADAVIRNLAKHLIGHALGLDHVTCGGPALCGTMDVMDIGHAFFIPGENLSISGCNLLGIAAIYTAASCELIPASIPYDCE